MIGWQTDEFPAFYVPSSGRRLPIASMRWPLLPPSPAHNGSVTCTGWLWAAPYQSAMPCSPPHSKRPRRRPYDWRASRVYAARPPRPFCWRMWRRRRPARVSRPTERCSSTMPAGQHALHMHITAIKKVDFLTHYDYNTNKYELIQGENQPDLFIFVWGNHEQ